MIDLPWSASFEGTKKRFEVCEKLKYVLIDFPYVLPIILAKLFFMRDFF